MLLIIGNETGRLPNITKIAWHAQLKLAVAANRAALAMALSSSRRNVVLFDEDELDIGLIETLEQHASEPHLRILVLCRHQAPQQYTQRMCSDLKKRIQWLPANTDMNVLADRIRDLRNAMLMIQREELIHAVEANEFLIQYQPKVRWVADESRWQTAEVEALIRWRHPAYGLIGPRHFLPEAEEFGLMGDITDLVLRATLNQLTTWESNGLPLDGSVNVSAKLLETDTAMPARMQAIVKEFEMQPERITFEVPATDVLSAACQAAIDNLRDLGFRIALEGFGSVPDSAQIFGSVQFDELKIHASLLIDSSHNETLAASLANITRMAKKLGIEICAQGVENTEVFDLIANIHCDKLQGYLVSEAVMPEIIQHQYANGAAQNEAVPDATLAYLM
ncbi:MAG: EAL domain-containing protein [Pseudomonadota bacterium]